MSLVLNDVDLHYDTVKAGRILALQGICFTLHEGQRLSIVGPSGCGKSSLLSLISGLIQSTKGQILFEGKEVTAPSPERMILFQNHALYPWATALENIEFVLRARNLDPHRAKAYLAQFALSDFATAYPHELSGGMRSRVGLARALATQPKLLLLDEPFSALDALTRDAILEDVLIDVRQTLVLVTHSIEEALFVGDQVLVLSGQPGRIIKQLKFTGSKPKRLIDLKKTLEFTQLEQQIYRHMRGTEVNSET